MADINFEVLDSKRRVAEGAKSPYLPMQYKNRAMIAGEHWAEWDPVQGLLVQHTRRMTYPDEKQRQIPEGKHKITDNVLRQAEEQRLAECVYRKPDMDWESRDLTQRSKMAAAIASKLADIKWDELNLDQKMYVARFMADMDAEAYLWVFWDKTIGPAAPDPNNEGKLIRLGDLNIQVIPDQQVFVEPNKDYLDDCNWVFVEFGMSVDEMIREFNIKESDLKRMKIEPTKPHTEITRQWTSLISTPTAGVSAPDRQDKKGETKQGGFAKLVHYLEKPCPQYPEGLHLVYTEYLDKGNRNRPTYKILAQGPLEFNGIVNFDGSERQGGIPTFPLFEIWSGKQPGRYYGDPEMNSARAQQHRLNELETQINEQLKTVGVPIIGLDTDAWPAGVLKGSEDSMVTRKDGVMFVKYSSNLSGTNRLPISPLSGMNPPAALYQEKAECERRIYEILGSPTVGEKSVRQDAYSIQNATARLERNVVMPQEYQVTKMMIYAIKLCQRYYGKSIPRELAYSGEFGIPMVQYITADDIDFKTCKIVRGSMMKSTALVRKQDAILARKLGLIPPSPQNDRRLLRMVTDRDVFPESTDSLNERNAAEENLNFLMMVSDEYPQIKYNYPRDEVLETISVIGQHLQQPDVKPIDKRIFGVDGHVLPDNDDHEIHAEVHNNFILSKEVRNLPPDKRDFLIDIINIHKSLHEYAIQEGLGFSERMQQVKQTMLQRMMEQKGGGGSPGESDMGTMMGAGIAKPHRRNPLSQTPSEFAPQDQNPGTDFNPFQMQP